MRYIEHWKKPINIHKVVVICILIGYFICVAFALIEEIL